MHIKLCRSYQTCACSYRTVRSVGAPIPDSCTPLLARSFCESSRGCRLPTLDILRARCTIPRWLCLSWQRQAPAPLHAQCSRNVCALAQCLQEEHEQDSIVATPSRIQVERARGYLPTRLKFSCRNAFKHRRCLRLALGPMSLETEEASHVLSKAPRSL